MWGERSWGDVRFSLLDNLVNKIARVISTGILDRKTGFLASGEEVARLLVIVEVWVIGVVVVMAVLGGVIGDRAQRRDAGAGSSAGRARAGCYCRGS